MKIDSSVLRQEAAKAKRQLPVWALLLCVVAAPVLCLAVIYPLVGRMTANWSEDARSLANLFSNVVIIFYSIAFCLLVEKRSLLSMGFCKKGIPIKFIKGMLLGIAAYALPIGICLASGHAELVKAGTPKLLALYFVAFIIQSASEEVAARSWFMVSATNKIPVHIAVIISSLLFTVPHYFNVGGLQQFYIINVFLVGIFLGLYILRTGHVWGACGFHAVFNWSSLICGVYDMGTSYYKIRPLSGMEWLTGGQNGFQCGFALTMVLLMGIALIEFLQNKKKDN